MFDNLVTFFGKGNGLNTSGECEAVLHVVCRQAAEAQPVGLTVIRGGLRSRVPVDVK